MKTLLSVVAFVSGACVMVIELVGSRLIAPYVGTSIFVWTALIGVVMGSLAFGYAAGGRLADRRTEPGPLALILFAASVCTAGIIVLRYLATASGILAGEFRLSAIAVAVLIFSPATILLGMVTPYVARLAIGNLSESGKTIGTLYALSTAGSIVGTFAGGFVLISIMGSTKIILATALVLLALAAAVGLISKHPRTRSLTVLGVAVIIAGSTLQSGAVVNGTLRYDGDTPYHRVWVYDTPAPSARLFSDTIHGIHSAILLDAPDEILLRYVRYFDIAHYFRPDASRALMIGAAVQTYPSYFAKRYPDKTMDSVEIDPALLPIARNYFNFTDPPNIRVVHADGRTFLNTATSSYDIAYLDAFSSIISIPFQLTSLEATNHLRRLLGPDGVAVVNIVAAREGAGSAFTAALYRTYREVFEHVYVFDVMPEYAPARTRNLILVATDNATAPQPPFHSNDPRFTGMLATYLAEPPTDGIVLTDDFAPVERFATAAFTNLRTGH